MGCYLGLYTAAALQTGALTHVYSHQKSFASFNLYITLHPCLYTVYSSDTCAECLARNSAVKVEF